MNGKMAGVEFFFGRENIPCTYQLKINSYSNLESDYIYYSTVANSFFTNPIKYGRFRSIPFFYVQQRKFAHKKKKNYLEMYVVVRVSNPFFYRRCQMPLFIAHCDFSHFRMHLNHITICFIQKTNLIKKINYILEGRTLSIFKWRFCIRLVPYILEHFLEGIYIYLLIWFDIPLS